MLDHQTPIVKTRIGPLWELSQYRDTKDPCPVFDGKTWHIFGSGGNTQPGETQEEWVILHATSPVPSGPWTEQPTVILEGLEGKHIAAPGVLYDKGIFHMYVQTEFLDLNGTIEYLTSDDGGYTFTHVSTMLQSIPETHEAALYDPHPAIIRGQKYISYSGSSFIGKEGAGSGGGEWVGQPDIYLAKSETNEWSGPWVRVGKILDHEDVVHHNQRDQMSYEWGLEGSQLIELPNGTILMNVVCFLPHGAFGTRQRIFFAFADKVTGPYYSAGIVLPPKYDWESGENGHAAAFMRGFDMMLFYQGRPPEQQPWRYGIAYFNVSKLQAVGKATLSYQKQLRKLTAEPKSMQLQRLTESFEQKLTIISFADHTRALQMAMRSSLNRFKK